MGIDYSSTSYFGWVFEDDEDWKKLIDFLDSDKFPYRGVGFLCGVEDSEGNWIESWDVLDLIVGALKKQFAEKGFNCKMSSTASGDHYSENFVVFLGTNLDWRRKLEDFQDWLKENKEAIEKISEVLGEPAFFNNIEIY